MTTTDPKKTRPEPALPCGCSRIDDCERRGCRYEQRCNCATLDDCLRRGCR